MGEGRKGESGQAARPNWALRRRQRSVWGVVEGGEGRRRGERWPGLSGGREAVHPVAFDIFSRRSSLAFRHAYR